MAKTRTRRGSLVLLTGLILLSACSTQPTRKFPDVGQLFPEEKPRAESDKVESTMVDIDGTLSMQGFARPASGKYGELLQVLHRSLNNMASGQAITYRRFGSRAEDLKNSEPIYVAASRPDFYKSSPNYATTRTDVVLRDQANSSIKIVITDLFEEKSDISSIEQALHSSGFPNGKAIGVWQWSLDYDGTIYDFDIRNSKGGRYTGQRPLYFLVVASKPILQRFSNALAETWTGSQPNKVVISSSFAVNPNAWLKLAGLQRLAVLQQIPGSVPVTVLRPAAGCRDVQFSAVSTLQPSPTSIGTPSSAVLSTANTHASLSRVMESKDSAQLNLQMPPDLSAGPAAQGIPSHLRVTVPCTSIPSGSLYLLRLTRDLKLDELAIPDWVQNSNASSSQLEQAFAHGDKGWGNKTLNLLPLLRDLLASAMHETPLGSVYFYIDRR